MLLVLLAPGGAWVNPGPAAAQDVSASAQEGPTADYYVVVAAESEDEVSILRFGPRGGEIVASVPVGIFVTEIDGPHGITLDPDGTHWYVSIAHGIPFGRIQRYAADSNEKAGEAVVGLFPASMAVTDDGLLFVANFNLHGDPVPSSVSVVETSSMLEIARIPTCTKPHGGRLSPDQTRFYSVCVGDEQLVEIDTRSFRVTRRMHLAPGRETALSPQTLEAKSELPADAEDEAPAARCGPTWVQPSPDGRHAFVACNKNKEVLEVDLEAWEVTRRFATGPGPYNLDVTGDGAKLVVTYKGGAATGIIDTAEGVELGTVPTQRTLPHGVALSSDNRYAFISVEGVGGEPGTVEMIDLGSLRRVAAVDMGKQAGGISFWKMETESR